MKIAGIIVAVLVLLFLSLMISSPLPAPPPFAGNLPPATPPAEMKIFRLPTGVTHTNSFSAYEGGSLFDARDFTMTAVLVKHPRGDLLIDAGCGHAVAAQLRMMPGWFRAITNEDCSKAVVDQLGEAGYPLERLKGAILTHAHWDHVSGLADFAQLPVWVTPEEREFIRDGKLTEVARSLTNISYQTYAFDGGPYLGFVKSHDVYGDGSIVIVPAPGHTPGSVIVFLCLPGDKRYALIGDLTWQREGISERRQRPWWLRIDANLAQVRADILHMASIAERFPDLVMVPAHDARGFAEIPLLAAPLPQR